MNDDHPMCRATIAGGTLTLNVWDPTLITSGAAAQPLYNLAREGVVLADLTVIESDGERELIVHFLPAGSGTREAEDLLLRWARQTGYRRVWLPDRIVDLDNTLLEVVEAEVKCPTCRLTWRDDSLDFWVMVRQWGYFPGTCPACNGSLPEWSFGSGSEPAAKEAELPQLKLAG